MTKALLIATALTLTLRAGEEVKTAPAPTWVLPAKYNIPEKTEPGQGSRNYLVVDQQAHLEEETYYAHYVTKINTSAGVEDYSQLSFDFQPDYETLTFHSLDVIRDGVLQDRLKDAEFEMIRQEKGLDRQLYDGEMTAHIILEDIRPGDTISYSYSSRGANPVFQGHVHQLYRLGYSIDLDFLRRSVIWDPATRDLTWQILESTLQPTESNLPGGLKKITWDKTRLKGTESEDHTPDSVIQYPWLEISDYTSWEDFGKWCLGIYQTEQQLPEEMHLLCDDFKAQGGTDGEIITRALFWVQENIRYLGSFLGEHTHEPHLLKDIARRRFGDCKDKGMLTIAMLRYLGFDAAPALVNTYNGDAVLRYLPGHHNFDHLIVHLLLDGETYWLDPTWTFKRGKLQDLYTPDYRHAFVIRDGQKTLSELQPRGLGVNHIEVIETFTLPDMEGSANLKVETTAKGREADILRRTFATDSWEKIQEDYREYYENYYPEIEVADSLSSTDDKTANTITISESYNISGFWTEQDSDNGGTELYGRFYAGYLKNSLTFPDKQKRKHPFSNPHPTNLSYRIIANLPEEWSFDPEDEKVEIPAFSFKYSARTKRSQLRLNYDFKSHKDAVPIAGFSEYQKATDTVSDTLSYGIVSPLTTGNATPTELEIEDNIRKSHILLGATACLSLLVSLIIAAALYFWNPRLREVEGPAPVGLGGWLILPIIGSFVTPFVALAPVINSFTEIDSNFTLFDEREHALALKFYSGSLVFTNIILVCLGILALVLLFRRRTSFPFVFSGIIGFTLLAQFSFLVFQDYLNPASKPETGDITTTLIKLGIWGTYMMVSKRVKATFTNRLGKAPLPSPPPLPPTLPEENPA